MYNVLDFGAAGDGVTLDTEAIQAALDTCCQKGGGTVLLPGGHIYKSGSLIIGSDTELHLESGAVLTNTGVIPVPEETQNFRTIGSRRKDVQLLYQTAKPQRCDPEPDERLQTFDRCCG